LAMLICVLRGWRVVVQCQRRYRTAHPGRRPRGPPTRDMRGGTAPRKAYSLQYIAASSVRSQPHRVAITPFCTKGLELAHTTQMTEAPPNRLAHGLTARQRVIEIEGHQANSAL